MARLSHLEFSAPADATSRDVAAGLAIGLAVSQEKEGESLERNAKTLARLNDEIESINLKLRNPSFLDKAPEPVVEKTRRRLVELQERRAALSAGRA